MEEKFVEIAKLKKLIKEILVINNGKDLLIKNLNEKNRLLTEEVDSQSKMLNELKEKTDNLKIAKSISLSDEDKTEVVNKINKIVREIDKSIGLLNE